MEIRRIKNKICTILSIVFVLQCILTTVSAYEIRPENVDVPIDIQIRETNGTWINGPATVGTKFDFRAVLDTKPVKKAFESWYDTAYENMKTLANGDTVLLKQWKEKLDNREIDGEFVIKIQVPSGAYVPKSVQDGKDMQGFNESAKQIFYEKSRNYTNNVLTLKIGTKGVEGGKLTAGVLKQGFNSYLQTLYFEVDRAYVKRSGIYTVVGDMNGYTNFNKEGGANVKVNFNGVQRSGISYEDPYNSGKISATVDLPIHKIYGKTTLLKDGAETNYSDVDIVLTDGFEELEKQITTFDGTACTYCFDNIPSGNYNVIAKKGDAVITKIALVEDEDVEINFVFGKNAISSIVGIIENDIPEEPIRKMTEVVVGNLDEEADSRVKEDEKKSEPTLPTEEEGIEGKLLLTLLTAEVTEIEEEPADVPENKQKTEIYNIQKDLVETVNSQKGKGFEPLKYLEATVNLKIWNDKTVEKPDESYVVSETNRTLELVYPLEIENKYDLCVYRTHENKGGSLIDSEQYDSIEGNVEIIEFKESKSGQNGTFYIDRENNELHIFTKYFSYFAIFKKDEPSISGGGGGGGVSNIDKKYTLTFNVDGDTRLFTPIETYGKVNFKDIKTPIKLGYEFDGWYYEPERINKITGDFTIDKNTVIYGHFSSELLDTEEHFAYVVGYPDDTVRPKGNITRAETATIFYRLLRENKVINIATDENEFTDVSKEDWFNKAISTMAKGGYIFGYNDGSFKPNSSITRAEFAAIATRFAVLEEKSENVFSDIYGHWAKDSIEKANKAGWITGYEDGTFRPQNYITRAEVMTLVNKMLSRKVNNEGLLSDAIYWKDMKPEDWYYFEVMEATNAHDWERQQDGLTENWTKINTNKIWTEKSDMENDI